MLTTLPSFLPDRVGPTVLFATAAAFLLIGIIVQSLRRKWAGPGMAKPATAGTVLMVIGLVFGAGFAFLASEHFLETRSWGNMANLLGGMVLFGLCVIACIFAFAKGGRFIGRLTLTAYLSIAALMVLAAVAYGQAVYTQASGAQDNSWWYQLYDICVIASEVLMWIVAIVLWPIALIWAVVIRVRASRKASKAAATAPTSPAGPTAAAAAPVTPTPTPSGRRSGTTRAASPPRTGARRTSSTRTPGPRRGRGTP